MSDDRWAEIPGRVQDRIEDISTAVTVLDFLRSHWWGILLAALVLALIPRRGSR